MKRRSFIKNISLAGIGLSGLNTISSNNKRFETYLSNRPAINKRTYTSKAVEDGNIVVLSYVITNKTAANGAAAFNSPSSIDGNTNTGFSFPFNTKI